MSEVSGADSTATFTPVVKLQEVKVKSGEEGEEELYKQRCALYRFAAEIPEWKERGRGDVRLLKNAESGKTRVLLRESKTLKLRMNHIVHPLLVLKPNAGSDRSWTWATTDFSEGCGPSGKAETFAIRFKDAKIAGAFMVEWNKCRESNKKIEETEAAGAPAAAAPAAAVEAKAPSTKNIWSEILQHPEAAASLSNETIETLWQSFDADKDGFIDVKELESLFTQLAEAMYTANNVAMTEEAKKYVKDALPEMISSALSTLDANHDGKLSHEEFKKLDAIDFHYSLSQ